MDAKDSEARKMIARAAQTSVRRLMSGEMDKLRKARERRGATGPAMPLPLKGAAAAMRIGVPKLRALIRAGIVLTCEGYAGHVPVSEIERFKARRKARRRARSPRS